MDLVWDSGGLGHDTSLYSQVTLLCSYDKEQWQEPSSRRREDVNERAVVGTVTGLERTQQTAGGSVKPAGPEQSMPVGTHSPGEGQQGSAWLHCPYCLMWNEDERQFACWSLPGDEQRTCVLCVIRAHIS